MEVLSLTAVLATIFGWCVLASRLQRAGLTAPIVFITAGFVFAEGLDILDLAVEPHLVKVIAEVTLVWVLFADASLVSPRQFRRDLGMYVRLLGVGLPLTVALGTAAALVVLDVEVWAALLIGAALAPTDAALGATVMSNPCCPRRRIRRALNVESGLNDGIATPIVLVAIAGVAANEGIAGVESPSRAVLALLVGVLAGATVGGLGGVGHPPGPRPRLALRGTRRSRRPGPGAARLHRGPVVDGNGFVAAFVGGLVFGGVAGRGGERRSTSWSSRAPWPR